VPPSDRSVSETIVDAGAARRASPTIAAAGSSEAGSKLPGQTSRTPGGESQVVAVSRV